MKDLSQELKIRAYTEVRTLESRADALEAYIGALKRLLIHGGPGACPDLVASAAEIRWQLRQLDAHLQNLEKALGFIGSLEKEPESQAEEPEQATVRGTTDVLPVADLVGVLSSARKTGTLTLQADGTMYVFEFHNGAVVHAITNHANPGMRLGSILVAQSKITEKQLRDNLEASSAANELLGDHLVSSQTVSVSDLRTALETQVQLIFEAAFELDGAHFTFLEGNLSNIAQRTSLNTTHLLLEAARQKDEKRREGKNSVFLAAKSALDSILPD